MAEAHSESTRLTITEEPGGVRIVWRPGEGAQFARDGLVSLSFFLLVLAVCGYKVSQTLRADAGSLESVGVVAVSLAMLGFTLGFVVQLMFMLRGAQEIVLGREATSVTTALFGRRFRRTLVTSRIVGIHAERRAQTREGKRVTVPRRVVFFCDHRVLRTRYGMTADEVELVRKRLEAALEAVKAQ